MRSTKTALWTIIREWLGHQKHIRDRVRLEMLEFGPPYAELCTVGNRYTYAYVYDDHISFITEFSITEVGDEARTDTVLILYAHDPKFFKKMKSQLLQMMYAGRLNWPLPERWS